MERSGSGFVQIITDPDPGGPKTYGSFSFRVQIHNTAFLVGEEKTVENQKYDWPVGICRVCADIVPDQRVEDDGGQVPKQLTLAPPTFGGKFVFL